MSEDNEFIKNKYTEYCKLKKEREILNIKMKNLDKEIKEYMVDNKLGRVTTEHGEIILCDKKINTPITTDSIIETLRDEINDQEKINNIIKNIFDNKDFNIKKTLKTRNLK